MYGLMNNSKWKEMITMIGMASLHIQLRLLGDQDYPMDYELSNLVISDIRQSSFVYVNKEIKYNDIAGLRLCKGPTAYAPGLCKALVKRSREN